MPATLKTILRVMGVGLTIFAAVHFIVDVASSLQTNKHPTPDGFVIDHRIEIPHTGFAVAVAGAALFALSFIRVRNSA